MHIDWINIEGLPPLSDVYFDCDRGVNVFIGPNASGKSTILRGIKAMHSLRPELAEGSEDGYIYELNQDSRNICLGVVENSEEGVSGSASEFWDTLPFLYIPATRINLPQQDIFSQTIRRPEPYGIELTEDDILDRHFCNYFGAFNGEYVEGAINRFRRELGTDRSRQNQLRKALDTGYSCAKSICPEVIHDVMPHPYVELRDEDDEEQHEQGFYGTGRIVHHDLGIVTTDDILGEPLYAGALSSGTQGTLLWIYALALKMAKHHSWQEGWHQKPAILLIDEIENHLHPTWQRRVIPALLEHFPGLQIFATTHSPFVVAGRKAGQVHLLKRDDEGRVTASTNPEDVIGWTADEILRNIMGVDDPTDDVTAAAARELRELRNSAPGRTEEAEEERQQKMQELRQKVNRDMLAGGPMAAQRELFEDHLTEILEEHRRSENLNQDGG